MADAMYGVPIHRNIETSEHQDFLNINPSTLNVRHPSVHLITIRLRAIKVTNRRMRSWRPFFSVFLSHSYIFDMIYPMMKNTAKSTPNRIPQGSGRELRKFVNASPRVAEAGRLTVRRRRRRWGRIVCGLNDETF